MMTKIVMLIVLSSLFCVGCSIYPKDFTYRYEQGVDTGLSSLIRTDGVYIVQRECDSTFFSVFTFYSDGLFSITTASDTTLAIECFDAGGDKRLSEYPDWGTYRIEGNLIRTQTIHQEGMGICTIFRDYEITPEGMLINVSDYVQPQYTNIGSMANYPSFRDNSCRTASSFRPLLHKRDSLHCSLTKKKWFRN